MTTKTQNIVVLGAGTVGSQVIRLINEHRDDLQARSGAVLNISAVLVRNLDAERDYDIDPELLTTDAEAAIDGADIVIELIGGIEPAYTYVKCALNNGSTVITGNKALLAQHGPELYELTAENDTDLYYEAAVAGAVPIVYGLRESMAGDRVNRIIGGWEAPAAWSQSINPVFTLLLIIPLATLRLRLGHNPGIGVQMIGGTIFTGLALLVLVPFAGLPAGAVPLLALMATYLFITLGELHVSPVGMAASTVLAPARYRTRFSALYFLTMAVGTALAGTLSTYYDPTDATAERNYFLAVGLGVMAVAGLMALFLPRINRLVREGEKETANDAAQESAAAPTAR